MRKLLDFARKKAFKHEYTSSQVKFDEKLGAFFIYMQSTPRPCFTLELLDDLKHFLIEAEEKIVTDLKQDGHSNLKFIVVSSAFPGTFNLGGDLNLFAELIERQDREKLLEYAVNCITVGHKASMSLDLPLTTITLIQGNAMGGGFEAALACNVIIAERGYMMGFPEVMFNLFPGMGAYTYLAQRINPVLAERMILSGKMYHAEELYEMGVIDYLAEPGEGEDVLKEYIHNEKKFGHARSLIRHIRKQYNPASYKQLLDITNLWVESALQLTQKELTTIKRLVAAQDRKMKKIAA